MAITLGGTNPAVTFPDATVQNTSAIVSGYVPYANLPAGSVLQVVSTTKTDTFATTSATFTDLTSLSVSITPKSSSNKIFVIVNTGMSSSSGSGLSVFNLVRNSTNIAQPATSPTFVGTIDAYQAGGTDFILPVSFSFLDSPSTTSSTTYKVQVRTNSGTLYINQRQTGDCAFVSTITVMEIAA